jgi:exonuclease SbcC
MSFADEAFDFPEESGLNLICGKNNDIPGSKNGAGKSTISNALCYSLFGQTKDNLKNENIHNKYVSGKDVRVVTFFNVDNNDYRIATGFNKSGHPYCELVEIIDGNENNLTKSSLIETRKFLADEILHCDMSIFLRTVLLSSDNNYNFFRLKKSEKKDFIEKIFDISIFGDMYNLIHKDVLSHDKMLLI